ncbi:type II/IV secretion system protein (plasmid) [Bacillus subtilis subsp. subtilis]|nr:ATPase, T2SS/T4P/T4SS family [Bacillus subtilis]AYK68284.1 type II/IV secretion system protein [Bacillus subtilis subsp. subtilis]
MSILLKEPITKETLDQINKILTEDHAELFHQAFIKEDSKEALKIVVKELFSNVLDTSEKVDYAIRELVGMGLIEQLKSDERVTDIGFDGNQLWVQGNDIVKYSLPFEEDEAIKTVSKFSSSTGTELTAKRNILNTSKDRMRLNAVHNSVAVDGTTFAIRVSRPGMALNEENFASFAPLYMLDFIKAAAKTRSNILISGETGTGKTEFQKLFINYIRENERIAFIETNKDIYIKETFPERDIFYWVANEVTSIEKLISHAALRSHPVWVMVAEVVGREVYQMVNGILTGHKIATTLHSVDARAQPQRLLGMAKEGYNVDDKMFLDNIYRYVDFGFHIEKIPVGNGKEIRYLNEVVAFNSDHSASTIFRQDYVGDGRFVIEHGTLPAEFLKKLKKFSVDYTGLPKEA